MANNLSPPIDTRTAERRELRFATLEDLERDIDRIIAADAAARLRITGNWTPGQVLGHVASWMSYPYEGFPIGPAPWFVRVIVGWRRKKYLDEGMPRGVRIPGAKDGTYGVEAIPLQDAAARLRKAIGQLREGERPRHPSPVFGEMTLDEVTRLNLRHAELHLGFLHPG